MPLVNGGPIGPDGLGGAYKNTDADDRAALWQSLGAAQVMLAGGALTYPVGVLAVDVATFRALVAERDSSGVRLSRGYHAWADVSTRAVFAAPSASARNDALVLVVADTSAGAGAFGTGVTQAGAQIVVVTGVSGTTVPRTDTEVQNWVGSGGWMRLADVRIDPTDTEVKAANVTKANVTAAKPPFIQHGSATVTVSGGTGSATVVFPSPFAAAPTITVSYIDGSPTGNHIGLGAISASQFDVHMASGTNASYGVRWIAVGTRP